MRDQEIIGLWEAYQQVYAQPEEVEQLDEIKQATTVANDKIPNFQNGKKAKPVPGLNVPPSPMEEGVDLFDYLLEYLVAEGYADTNKAALAIMANMSEDWKQSIVEDIRGLPYKPPVKRGGPMDEMMRGSRPNSGSSNGSSGAGMRDRDEPLWDSDQKPEDVKVTPTPTRPPVRKPQPTNKKDPPMRDEPLW